MANTAQQISPEGLSFIKLFQGFSAEPYLDECHLWVVGYGHLIQENETFVLPLSRQQAQTLLVEDIHACQEMLKHELQVQLTQSQYDALVSLALSIGPQTLAGSAILRLINQRRFPEAMALWQADIEMNGIRGNGLNIQRQAECTLFGIALDGKLTGAE
ncbi:lysozyme [Pseudocitrobacter cyperus]|uniref:Lysozyme n=1 Tax=Pseudocitrobacter cyperus TaxID=3112843 RepID=A0ABV0HMM0_9ENTR